MATKYGYARCSTSETKQDIGRQIRELKQMGVARENIFLEYQSGAKTDRLELSRMLDNAQAGDEIISLEISRITRSTKQLCDIIDLCKTKKLRLTIKDSVAIDCTGGSIDPMTEAFLQMAGVFAQLERGMTSERIKSGLANARARGRLIGRPRLTMEGIPAKVKANYRLYLGGAINKIDYARLCGVSRPTLDKYLSILIDG